MQSRERTVRKAMNIMDDWLAVYETKRENATRRLLSVLHVTERHLIATSDLVPADNIPSYVPYDIREEYLVAAREYTDTVRLYRLVKSVSSRTFAGHSAQLGVLMMRVNDLYKDQSTMDTETWEAALEAIKNDIKDTEREGLLVEVKRVMALKADQDAELAAWTQGMKDRLEYQNTVFNEERAKIASFVTMNADKMHRFFSATSEDGLKSSDIVYDLLRRRTDNDGRMYPPNTDAYLQRYAELQFIDRVNHGPDGGNDEE